MAMLTIGEVARRAGLRTSALRYYEEVGVLPAAERSGGQRRYREAILSRLAVIRLAQEVGFTIAEIRSLVAGFDEAGVAPERWRELATRKLAEIEALIDRAEHMKQVLAESQHCGCLSLDACSFVLARQQAEVAEHNASRPSPLPTGAVGGVRRGPRSHRGRSAD